MEDWLLNLTDYNSLRNKLILLQNTKMIASLRMLILDVPGWSPFVLAEYR